MRTGPKMHRYSKIPTRMACLPAVLLLTLSFATQIAAQDHPTQAPGQPAGQAFPSATPSPSPTDAASAAEPASSSPALGVGDMVEVNVYNVPELTTKSRLGNNGDIYLPLVDYVHFAGLSVEEAKP